MRVDIVQQSDSQSGNSNLLLVRPKGHDKQPRSVHERLSRRDSGTHKHTHTGGDAVGEGRRRRPPSPRPTTITKSETKSERRAAELYWSTFGMYARDESRVPEDRKRAGISGSEDGSIVFYLRRRLLLFTLSAGQNPLVVQGSFVDSKPMGTAM